MSENINEPRRRAVKLVFALSAAGIATLVGVPVIAAFLSPARKRTVSGPGEPLDFGKVSDLPVGVPQKLDVVAELRDAWDRFDPRPIGAIWLLRRDDDTVAAFSAVCPHLGCSVGFDAGQQVFACPCHASAFGKDDGAWIAGPSPRGLDPLPVELVEGRVRVTYRQFVQGVPERREA